MVLEVDQAGRPGTGEAGRAALEALAAAGRALAEGTSLGPTLEAILAATAGAVGATVAVARVAEGAEGRLCARAVHAASPAVAALLEGSMLDHDGLVGELDEAAELPPALRRAAEGAGASAILLLPVRARGELLGTVELLRPGAPFSEAERLVGRIAADHAAAAIRALGLSDGADLSPPAHAVLELAGEALAAGGDDEVTAPEVARVAARATGAAACFVWRRDAEEPPALLGSFGADEGVNAERGRTLAERALTGHRRTGVDVVAGGTAVTLPLGQPAVHVLQLFFAEGAEPDTALLARLGTFGVRAAHALRAADRARTLRLELQRTSALLQLVAQANEELSLAHTLETAIERVADLLGAERIGVYLRDEGRLVPSAGHALAGPHAPVAERLLELALGPRRGRGILVVDDATSDPALAGVAGELAATGIEAAIAAPLLVPEQVVGLLAVYPARGRVLTGNEAALLAALAAQLAVSVQNAQLHEQATQLGAELEDVLALERQAARQLRSLYEISRSFAQSLSLDATLEAVARTIVELLGVDAAVIRMPDARGETFVTRAVHVAEARLGPAIRTVASAPQPLASLPRRELLAGRPVVLDAQSAAESPAHRALVPFLEKGSTAVVVPIATPVELLGTVKLLSLDPARPIAEATVALALSVAAQAALAIDNARLYQHQKEFADTMQRSLLPQAPPQVRGIEVGDVYEASARLDVGGDLYDFVELADGRLAVVLGDVTGHGVDAAADMAMAKFVFRSLTREHPAPAGFLAAANDVVCDEIAPAKFITMLYLTVDGGDGTIRCASAGHPQPRLVAPDGTVTALDVRGLALGIDRGIAFDEAAALLPPGGSLVLYTDGVIEARREGELYGAGRLDALLAARHDLPAKALAQAVLADCRLFGGGELPDDCAVVVIRRDAAA